MGVDFIYPEFEVVRNPDRCIACRVCERQCANEVHALNPDTGRMISDESKCVNCQRCVSLCPTRALKIVKSDCRLRENANWQNDTIREIYKQANSGGVLLSSMGNPKPLPVYWDKILINASQVTNPPIDPLREPMETRVFLGKRPEKIRRDENGRIICDLPPQISLAMPVMFSAMSYGSISYNAHASLARAAAELGILYNTGEG
ncbi:MAG: 4Fe-4S binding protein, partial [Lachnospiraceae bacterium]|nr:4Fe-4S binding protein [Lachnospiraceae bacterium]